MTRDSICDDAISIWQAGVDAVNAQKLVEASVALSNDSQQLTIAGQKFQLEEIEKIIVVGFGKASGAMAIGFENRLGESILNSGQVVGLVSVPQDKVVETKSAIEIVGGRPPGENLPTEKVKATTQKIVELVKSAGPKDVCVCLISGGGSALLELPIEPTTIDEFRQTTSFLSSAGATIYELNSVRRAISSVKGGSLAAASGGAPVISLIVSDVVGDPLDVIASGPTVAPSGELDPLEIIRRYDPERKQIPATIYETIATKSRPPVNFDGEIKIVNQIIGNIETAMNAAKVKAIELGYSCTLDEPSGDQGDAETVGRQLKKRIVDLIDLATGKRCLIQGGETTVRLSRNPGKGGRNQHLVLSTLEEFVGRANDSVNGRFCLLSGGTDGEDGTNSVAGALIDHKTVAKLGDPKDETGIEIREAIRNCDSHTFLKANGCLLATQPTLTNVGDLRICLTEHKAQ